MEAKRTVTSNESYKDYLMTLFASLAASDHCLTTTTSPWEIATMWGRTQNQASEDIKKVRKVLMATQAFMSKAVDDNWK